MTRRTTIGVIAGIMLGAALCVPLGVYWGGGMRLIDVLRSPDGRERIEYYTPSRWQLLFARRGDMPAIARLVRLDDTAVVHDSGVFDLSGEGQAIWAGNVVQIGTSAVYDRRTARWEIIQE